MSSSFICQLYLDSAERNGMHESIWVSVDQMYQYFLKIWFVLISYYKLISFYFFWVSTEERLKFSIDFSTWKKAKLQPSLGEKSTKEISKPLPDETHCLYQPIYFQRASVGKGAFEAWWWGVKNSVIECIHVPVSLRTAQYMIHLCRFHL